MVSMVAFIMLFIMSASKLPDVLDPRLGVATPKEEDEEDSAEEKLSPLRRIEPFFSAISMRESGLDTCVKSTPSLSTPDFEPEIESPSMEGWNPTTRNAGME